MKKVIVVGGGFAGAYIAKALEKKFKVILIDSKDYFEFTPSVLRTLVEISHAKKIQVPHKNYLINVNVLIDDVVSVTSKKVITKKSSFNYDYLAICSGSRYQSPIKEEHIILVGRSKELTNYFRRLESAKKVLIVGGGIVGTELAAEIITKYPDKKVVLVHNGNTLMPRNPYKAQKYAHDFLVNKGVEVILTEKVIYHDKKAYITDKKRSITADLAFLCTGITPNSEFMKQNFSLKINKQNSICVDSTLRVVGTKNMFAAGDVTNIKEEKTAQNSELQAKVVVKNIVNLEKNKKLINYVSSPRIMVISLGKYNGIIVYKSFVLTGIIPAMLKKFVEWKTMRRYNSTYASD